jgi:hypothetical protein
MAQSLVSPQLESLAVELSRSTWVQVYYLDSQGEPRRVCYDRNWVDENIRIVMKPHLVVTHQIQDASSPDGPGYRLETVEVPLERVLLTRVSENEPGAPDDAQDTLWVNGPASQLLRLVP